MRDELLDVHEDAHAELLENPFYSTPRFWERFEAYIRGLNFTMATGRLDGQLIGYAFGSTLPAESGWWNGLQEAADTDIARETGNRTFSFREFLVRKAYQGHGFGRKLHDALLADRPEERATLLVRPDNAARDLYLRWGWREVGRVQPFPDSPRFVSMVLVLRG